MADEIRRGTRGQLIGLNLWVVCAFLGFLVFSAFLSSVIGFLLLFIIVALFLIGAYRLFKGLYLIIKGSGEGVKRSISILSVFMLFFSPFILALGFISPAPLNYILIQVGLLFLLISLVIPYLPNGGMITGIPAIISAFGLSGVILGYVLFGSISLSWTLPFGFGISYFIFLELSVFISYLKTLRSPPGSKSNVSIMPVVKSVDVPSVVPRPEKSIFSATLTTEKVPISDVYSSPAGGTGEARRGKVTSFEEFVKEMGKGTRPAPERRKPPVFHETHRGPGNGPKKRVEAEVEEEIDLDMEDVLMGGEDLYSILKVDRSVSINELRKAYRKRALLYHPDLNRDVGELYRETINEEMRKLNKAKEILFDPVKRREYDRQLETLR
jgi:hypothetical protein